MSRVPVSLLRSVFVLLLICCAFESVSCGFHPTRSDLLRQFRRDQPHASFFAVHTIRFPDIGTMGHPWHGTAKVDHTNIIKVQQSVPLPGYADKATAQRLARQLSRRRPSRHQRRHRNRQHQIQRRPGREKPVSLWIATGSLTDNGYDKGLNWSYFFTVIAWNSIA